MTNNTNHGFTLIEVIISLAILAILGIITTLFFNNNKKEIQLSAQDISINMASAELLEQLLSLPISVYKEGTFTEEELKYGKLFIRPKFKLYLSDSPFVKRKLTIKYIELANNTKSLLLELTTTVSSKINNITRSRKCCLISSYDIRGSN